MSDFIVLYFSLALVGVVIIQGIERYFYGEQVRRKEEKLLEENSRLVKAIIAKNAQDYVMTTSIDKVPSDEPVPPEPDLVPEESLSDEDFMKALHKDLKK